MAELKMKQYIKIKETSVKEFTDEMTFIINAMWDKNKKDNDINEIRDGYMIARKENKDCIIMQAGPYLWEYRKVIKSGDLNPLLNNDFKNEITSVQGSLPDASGRDNIQNIISKIKRTWHLFTALEQETLKKKFNKMLAHYATYTKTEKEIKTLEV